MAAVTATRLSPGVYRVNGKTIRAATSTAAIAAYNKQYGKPAASNPKPTTPAETQPTTGTGSPQGSAEATGRDIAPGASSKVQGALSNEADVQAYQAEANVKLNNANTTNPFGSSTTTMNPDGTVSVNQTLSQDQQGILDKGEDLTKIGQDLAAQNLQGYSQFSMGQDTVADRARMEDAVYGRLTRDFDQRQGQDQQDAEQALYNRGIAYSADPNSRYQQEIKAVSQRYDDARSNARAQAVELGGAEYQRGADIGLASHQQMMSDTSALQQQGVGLQVPNFQQYQGTSIDMKSPTEVDLAYQQLANDKNQTDAAIKAANRPRGNGGGTGQTDSPFNTNPPPGAGG
jgi:hypothetical protein